MPKYNVSLIYNYINNLLIKGKLLCLILIVKGQGNGEVVHVFFIRNLAIGLVLKVSYF